MTVRGIDPRDTEWEVERPVYRVYVWRQPRAPGGVSREHLMFQSDEYRLTGAMDVGEVLDWARMTAEADQTFTLYVERRHGDSPGLIQLTGVDPTVPT